MAEHCRLLGLTTPSISQQKLTASRRKTSEQEFSRSSSRPTQKIAKTGLWKERVAGQFSEKNFWEWPIRSNWEPEVRRAFSGMGLPTCEQATPGEAVAGSLDARHDLDGGLLEDRFSSKQDKAHHPAESHSSDACSRSRSTTGHMRISQNSGAFRNSQNEEKIGNIFECLATYYIMHKCWDGVRCIVRTAFEVQGGECMKCGDFTMVNKLRMYARDHKLHWVEQNLPNESTMAGELLRAAIPSLLVHLPDDTEQSRWLHRVLSVPLPR